ncbi:hypothetical protein ACFE04_008445 [Oxalis oulophora]
MGSLCFLRQLQADHNITSKQQSIDDDQWMMIIDDDENSSEESSCVSNGSSNYSSSDTNLEDDASSSSSTSNNNNNNEALYDLSELLTHLPIKRGLSKFYNGKSQSFTSLSRVTSLEDLAKNKETPYRRKMAMKPCKSYGANLDNSKSAAFTLPKSTISKKVSRNSISSFTNRRNVSFLSRLPPPIPVKTSLLN